MSQNSNQATPPPGGPRQRAQGLLDPLQRKLLGIEDDINKRIPQWKDTATHSIPAMVAAITVLFVVAVLLVLVISSVRSARPPASLAPDKRSWYFADGSTLAPSQTWFSILNPGKQVAQATIKFYASEPGQLPREYTYRINPETQVRVPADKVMPGAMFGAEIYSEQAIFVERFTMGERDGTTSPGLRLAKDWYFPDAHTESDYQTWLMILNPGLSAAYGAVTFLPVQGYCQPYSFAVEPQSRLTITVRDQCPQGEMALIVHSDTVPVVVEHVTSYEGGNAIYGGPGVTSDVLTKTATIAIGNTQAWFSSYLAILNPTGQVATVTATFVGGNDKRESKLLIPAQSKANWNLNDVSSGTRLAVRLTSDTQIAVQLVSSYVNANNEGKVAAYSLLASPQPAKQWFLPETMADDTYDSYLSLFNPGGKTASVKVTYIIEDQGPITRKFSLGSMQRTTQRAADEVIEKKEATATAVAAATATTAATGAPTAVAAKKVVAVIVNSTEPIVAERVTMFRHSVGATSSAGIPNP